MPLNILKPPESHADIVQPHKKGFPPAMVVVAKAGRLANRPPIAPLRRMLPYPIATASCHLVGRKTDTLEDQGFSILGNVQVVRLRKASP